MASDPTRLSADAQSSLVRYVTMALEENKKRNDLIEKMVVIDQAYARYKQTEAEQPGVDKHAGDFPCGTLKDITAPIIVSQVDSYVGYLADIYCSGYPMFPVASNPKVRGPAQKLQSIIDNHAILGGYQRQFLKFFRDCMKYNFGAVELDWAPIERYSVLDDVLKPLDPTQVKKQTEHYNRATRRDPYNLVLDPRVEDMADIPVKGEFAGYVELLSRIELIREMQYLETTGFGYNTTQALHTSIGAVNIAPSPAFSGMYYREKPQISDLITQRSFKDYYEFDWNRWMNDAPQKRGRPVKGMYEVATLYARIIPEEHKIYGPNRTAPQIWRIKIVNNAKLIQAKRIISAFDVLPLFIGQPFEDGFAEQTQSLAEMQIPYQDTVSKLINIRIHAARRAVADRGIYDPKMIDQTDVNSPHPAAKIPIKPNSKLGGKQLEDAYKSIPFDPRGTDGVIQDAQIVTGMSGQLTGLNKPQQGEFQKGNKSVKEWSDTMSGSDNRLRLPAMALEYQVFGPFKEQMKLNIYQNGPTGVFQDMKKGEPVEVTSQDIMELRKTVLSFKIADGYLPVSKIAATGAIAEGMTLIGNSVVLQQSMGPMLPGMFAHLMQLNGVMGLEEYIPQTPQDAAQNIQAAQAQEQAPTQE